MASWPRRLALHVLFLGTALAVFWGRWQGRSPFIYLGADAGRMATYAAMCDYPQFFRWREVSLKGGICLHPHLILINMLRGLENLVGDFGTATVVLLMPVVFLQLWGFYLVGRELLRRTSWALVFTFLHLPLVWLRFPDGTHWGIYDDPWARHLYQAVLPFLWWSALHFVERPKVWPWILVANALAMPLHLRNGAGWMLAFWTGFVLLLPRVLPRWEHRRRILAGMTGAVMLFFLPLLWAFRFALLGILKGASPPVPPAVLVQSQQNYVQALIAAPLLFVLYNGLLPRLPVVVFALIGMWILPRLGTLREQWQARMLLTWSAVIFLHAGLLHLVSPRFAFDIYQAFFIRNLRFWIPLGLTFACWLLARWQSYRLENVPQASWLTLASLVPFAALGAFPAARALEDIRGVARFLNTRAVDMTLWLMARVPNPDSVLWTRRYFRLALQTGLEDGMFLGFVLVILVILSIVWRVPLWQFKEFVRVFQTRMQEKTSLLSTISLAVLAVLWIWGHSEGGAVALLQQAWKIGWHRPGTTVWQQLYWKAIPHYVPPREVVFTPDPYPWEIGYISKRNFLGGIHVRPVVRWMTRWVRDPEQRAKVWLALARKYRAKYMVTVDIPVEVWQRSDMVKVLYGQEKAVLLRIEIRTLTDMYR